MCLRVCECVCVCMCVCVSVFLYFSSSDRRRTAEIESLAVIRSDAMRTEANQTSSIVNTDIPNIERLQSLAY